MTCIATDGKTMAADSRMCAGSMIMNDATEKIFKAPDGSVVGIAGDMSSAVLVRQWFEGGCDFETIPHLRTSPKHEGEERFEALVLRPDGTVDWIGENFAFVRYAVPCAIGSGSEMALAAMMCGLEPIAAVRLSAEKVTTVGGRIHKISLTKTRGG